MVGDVVKKGSGSTPTAFRCIRDFAWLCDFHGSNDLVLELGDGFFSDSSRPYQNFNRIV